MAQQPLSPTESWARIDSWLSRHAPSQFALLRPPSTAEALRQAEDALGSPLPAALAKSLQCHDGLRAWATVLPEQCPLGVDGMVEHWRTCMEIASENGGLTPQPRDDEPWWLPLWIPWAESADGNVQVIDQRPGRQAGRLGWAGHGGGGDFSDTWPDLATLLHAVARALLNGGDVRGLRPYLTDRDTLWWDEVGCEERDGRPLKPASVGLG